MPKKIQANPNLMQQIIESYKATGSCHATAAALGVGATTVYRVTRAHGVTKERTGPQLEKQKPIDMGLLRKMHADGASAGDIAKALGVSPWAVLNRFRIEGLQPLKRGTRTMVFAPEAVAQAIDLRARGLSQTEIGKILGASQAVISRLLRENGVVSEKHASGRNHGSWMGGLTRNGEGYILEAVPPNGAFASMRNSAGYVSQHRLVMAQNLGRPLYKHETVHHINGDRTDNRIGNLQLRIGAHGAGVAMKCACCGSTNLVPEKLAEVHP